MFCFYLLYDNKRFEQLRKFFLLHVSSQLFKRILRVTSTWTIEWHVIILFLGICCKISIASEVASTYQGKTFDFDSSSKPNVDKKTVRQFSIQCNCLFDPMYKRFFWLYTVATDAVKFYFTLDPIVNLA